MNDKEIIELLWERDNRAISELEIKYGTVMKRYARRFLADQRDAEEVYNDALVAVWNTIPPEKPQKLLSYAMKLLDYKTVDRIRYIGREKRKRTEEVLFSEFDEILNFAGAAVSAEDTFIGQRTDVINEFLENEDATSRKIFLKRYFFGKNVSDIAREHGISESAVYTRISRTKQRLLKFLERKGLLT